MDSTLAMCPNFAALFTEIFPEIYSMEKEILWFNNHGKHTNHTSSEVMVLNVSLL